MNVLLSLNPLNQLAYNFRTTLAYIDSLTILLVRNLENRENQQKSAYFRGFHNNAKNSIKTRFSSIFGAKK